MGKRLGLFVTAFTVAALVSTGAEAQSQVAVASTAAPSMGGDALAVPVATAEHNDDERGIPEHPMSWASVGVKLGLDSITSGQGSIKGYDSRIGRRMGVHVGVPINLGGDGASFTFEPYMSRSAVSHDVKDTTGVVTGSEAVNLSAYGVYLGPTFNIHVARPVYVGFGAGLKGAYIKNPAFDYAYDLYARIPVHGTYYVSRYMAVVAEVGVAYGASVFVDKPSVVTDPVTRTARNVRDDPQFGLAFSCDATVGMRIP